jgi:hypothetical protein
MVKGIVHDIQAELAAGIIIFLLMLALQAGNVDEAVPYAAMMSLGMFVHLMCQLGMQLAQRNKQANQRNQG